MVQLIESLQDAEAFLKSKELKNKLNYLLTTGNVNNKLICRKVIEEFQNRFDLNNPEIKVTNVMVLQALGNDFEVVEPNYSVIEYNGNYYDYSAIKFANIFNIKKEDLPVIQPRLTSDRLISQNISTIKSYVLLEV